MQTDATSHNIVACCWPTMLRPLVWSKKFDRFQTIHHKCKYMPTLLWFQAVPCKRIQHIGPNNVACCWPTSLRPFAWAYRRVYSDCYFLLTTRDIYLYIYISGWIFEKVIDSYKPSVRIPPTPPPPSSQTFQSQALIKMATV